ncbi:S-adenosyl-L-methionine-dependent methyltransferase [Cytidiella melzeri]|nr:S-adenosyl-L-methionine-dependent methyltransferase [Cytidiella melzeri]
MNLTALRDLITSSVDAILASCDTQPFPSADEPFSVESEAIRMDPHVQKHSGILIAAATQLIAAVRPPPLTLLYHGISYYIPACIRTVIELHVAEIIRDAGPQGMHVNEIAAPTNCDPGKLARVLRLLATSYIFQEVAPNTFAHNRISSLLDTGKAVAEILADPQGKHDKTIGVAAFMGHFGDESLKSGGYLADTLTNPNISRSNQPNETAFNTAFKTDLGIFDWFELPENQYRRRRFANAMQGAQSLTPPGATVKGFDWQSLPKDSVVVDVGGGFGSQSLSLAQTFNHLKFVVQDQAGVISDAPKFWEARLPQALETGRVEFQVHNFFDPQPVREPAVFFMRMILHDWSDEYCLKILRQLRAAAGPHTKLIVSDNVLGYACEETDSVKDIPGGAWNPAPAPLLPNYGSAAAFPYLADIHMLALMNGSERTVASFQSLYEQSGWRLVNVEAHGFFRGIDSKIIGVPA